MPMEGWVKCLSPQNTFGVSGVNSVAAKSNTIDVTGGPLLQTENKTYHKMPPYCSFGVIQVSVSPDIQFYSKRRNVHRVFSPHTLHTHSHPTVFRPKTWCKWWHHRSSMFMFCFCILFFHIWRSGPPVTSIVLDLAAMPFIPGTQTLHPSLKWHCGEWISIFRLTIP